MRKLLVSLLAIFAISGVSFAQEEQAVTRSLSFYLDSFTGQLNKDSGDAIFFGNEFEFGMTYSQNFATVPWLSMWVKALVVTTADVASEEDGTFLGNTKYSIAGYGMPRAQVGINLGGYSIFAFDTRGLLAQENYYTLRLGAAGAVTFQTILEMWVIPQALMSDHDGDPTTPAVFLKKTIVDLFEIRFNYEIGFAPSWTFRTKLGFRLGALGYDWPDHSTNPVDSSATRFGQSFHIRWENQVVWAVTPSFYTWLQLRYQAKHIAYAIQEVQHDVFLQAGLGYSFDFSDN